MSYPTIPFLGIPGHQQTSATTSSPVGPIEGDTIRVRTYETWSQTVTDSDLSLLSYEALALVVKTSPEQADSEAVLLVRTDTGLSYIGGAAAASSTDGSLTRNSATSFSFKVAMTVTGAVTPGRHYTAVLKGFDEDTAPDEGYTLGEWPFIIYKGVYRATS